MINYSPTTYPLPGDPVRAGQVLGHTQAHARTTDPGTSHEAAASLSAPRVRKTQLRLLVILATADDPVDDTELAATYTRTWPGEYVSPSGLRTRRSELVDLGLVEDSGERVRLTSGRRAVLWRITDKGLGVVSE
jgi:hypothetical protein